MATNFQPIETFDGNDGDLVDLWLYVPASPRSMGISDAWRVIDCYRRDGTWFDSRGELWKSYITHWVSIPESPPPPAQPAPQSAA